ncbi:MAG: bifunctional demethylmenaquinone methyltransferase/2-methoxy-6-polyprenyl-1,4-benzoquinol methylase UbiE [Calditrichia bacterium]
MTENRVAAPVSQSEEPSRREVWKMFDRIAGRYDLLNRLLSFGQDVVWRKRVSRHLSSRSDQRVLDLATGTGDLLISIFKHSKNVKSGVGIDMAEKMLEVGREKLTKRNLNDRLTLQTGNAVKIPFSDKSFDAVTISFGIRNVSNVSTSLEEMHRVLRQDGRAIILEFSLPGNAIVRHGYLFYFRHILPRLGSLISGDGYAYRYLNQTVETFPYGREFCKLMTDAGFDNVVATPLTFGIATIYQGDRR